jgi:2-hydroxychromene-2-carboxylate isomerase
MEGAQILIDAQREAHTRDPVRGGPMRARACTEQYAVGRGLRRAHEHGLLLVVQQALEHAAAAAQNAVHAAARQAKRSRRPYLDALLDAAHGPPSAALVATAEQVHVHQQRATADDLHEL